MGAIATGTVRCSGESVKVSAKRNSFQARMKESRRSEEHTSELQSLMRISYAVFCLKKKKKTQKINKHLQRTIIKYNKINRKINTTHTMSRNQTRVQLLERNQIQDARTVVDAKRTTV